MRFSIAYNFSIASSNSSGSFGIVYTRAVTSSSPTFLESLENIFHIADRVKGPFLSLISRSVNFKEVNSETLKPWDNTVNIQM